MTSDENKKSRCIFCGKRLIDEKIPVCLRCKLIGRDYAEKTMAVVGSIALTLVKILPAKRDKN